jgi:NagD protein
MAYSILCDIDGVIHRGTRVLPGAARFVKALCRSGRTYCFLTNSAEQSPRELKKMMQQLGFNIPEDRFYTSGQATAEFIAQHARRPRVYWIGSQALGDELRKVGARFDDKRPEFVVVSRGGPYTLKQIDKAIELVSHGANLISTNHEPAGLTEYGIKAGSGGLVAPIERAVGFNAYVVGKPNHLMIRGTEDKYGIRPEESLMIGDSLHTDIDVGMQAQMKTVLVLTGHTTREILRRSPYKPDYVFKNVGEINLDKLP